MEWSYTEKISIARQALERQNISWDEFKIMAKDRKKL